jgi:hypothetical protein
MLGLRPSFVILFRFFVKYPTVSKPIAVYNRTYLDKQARR